MLTLILAEAELEPIPTSLCSHPSVRSAAAKRGKKPYDMILDSSTHHSAMTTIPEGERRGRPDIVHLFLLTALESIVNKQGQMHVIIHTRNDEEITVASETRIIKNYERFIGLMEQLFQKKVIPDSKNPLFQLTSKRTLPMILSERKADRVIACSSNGKLVKLPTYFAELKKEKSSDIICIIGGFPKGEFHNNISDLASDIISLYPEMIPAWSVAAEIIVNYENIFL